MAGTNTGGGGNNGTWSFTIDYSQLSGGTYTPQLGDVIQYFVVAQDQAGTPNVGANPVTGDVQTSVLDAATGHFPTTPNSYTIDYIT